MNALAAKLKKGWALVTFQDLPLPEPDPVNAKPRAMTGFFAGLSPDQQERALAYRGEETHGEQVFLRCSR